MGDDSQIDKETEIQNSQQMLEEHLLQRAGLLVDQEQQSDASFGRSFIHAFSEMEWTYRQQEAFNVQDIKLLLAINNKIKMQTEMIINEAENLTQMLFKLFFPGMVIEDSDNAFCPVGLGKLLSAMFKHLTEEEIANMRGLQVEQIAEKEDCKEDEMSLKKRHDNLQAMDVQELEAEKRRLDKYKKGDDSQIDKATEIQKSQQYQQNLEKQELRLAGLLVDQEQQTDAVYDSSFFNTCSEMERVVRQQEAAKQNFNVLLAQNRKIKMKTDLLINEAENLTQMLYKTLFPDMAIKSSDSAFCPVGLGKLLSKMFKHLTEEEIAKINEFQLQQIADEEDCKEDEMSLKKRHDNLQAPDVQELDAEKRQFDKDTKNKDSHIAKATVILTSHELRKKHYQKILQEQQLRQACLLANQADDAACDSCFFSVCSEIARTVSKQEADSVQDVNLLMAQNRKIKMETDIIISEAENLSRTLDEILFPDMPPDSSDSALCAFGLGRLLSGMLKNPSDEETSNMRGFQFKQIADQEERKKAEMLGNERYYLQAMDVRKFATEKRRLDKYKKGEDLQIAKPTQILKSHELKKEQYQKILQEQQLRQACLLADQAYDAAYDSSFFSVCSEVARTDREQEAVFVRDFNLLLAQNKKAIMQTDMIINVADTLSHTFYKILFPDMVLESQDSALSAIRSGRLLSGMFKNLSDEEISNMRGVQFKQIADKKDRKKDKRLTKERYDYLQAMDVQEFTIETRQFDKDTK